MITWLERRAVPAVDILGVWLESLDGQIGQEAIEVGIVDAAVPANASGCD